MKGYHTPSSLSSSSTLDFYQVVQTLGSGSTCKVKLLRDPFSEVLYAGKIIRPLPSFPYFYYRSKLLAEVGHLRSLQHKHIVKYFSYKESGSYMSKSKGFYKCMYIILEYCPHGELFHILKNGALGLDITLFFFKQIIEAIRYINQNGLAHGDLKPENILIGEDYSVRIIDFQLEGKKETGKLYGTDQYLPPEVRTGLARAGTAADLFMIGINLFIMYVGCPPFNRAQDDDLFFYTFCRDRQQFWKYFETRRPFVKFTEDFKEIIEGLLEPDAEKRWNVGRVIESGWVSQTFDESKARDSIRVMVDSKNINN